MYHRLVRRRSAETFALLTRGEWRRTLPSLARDVHHVFPGDHPLGGERRSRDAVERWFGRLERLFPGHDFTVHEVRSGGGPWNTWVCVRWSARLRPQVGPTYDNDGTHWIRLRWGRVVAFHAYLDTQLIATACETMLRAGVEEAAAAPIVD